MQKIAPFLWFDKDAGEAARFYTSIFPGSKITSTKLFDNTPSGVIEIVSIELFGQEYTLMAAGPMFKFTEAISFVIRCDSQEEIDYYWSKLSAEPNAEQCGWLKDKYGLSWQVVPTVLNTLLADKDAGKVARVTAAFLKMKKFDIAALQRAYEGS